MKRCLSHPRSARTLVIAEQRAPKNFAALFSGLLIAALIIFFTLSPSFADEETRLGPEDSVPEFELIDQYGSFQSLQSLSGKNGLLLAFIRSIDWCPYCQNQVFNLVAYEKKFKEIGYGVATLSYDSPLITMSFADTYGIDMTILSDTESETIKDFGLLNRRYPETSKYFGVAIPAIYIINPEGTITHVFAEEDYKKRPNLESVLTALAEEKEKSAAQNAQAINASAGPQESP